MYGPIANDTGRQCSLSRHCPRHVPPCAHRPPGYWQFLAWVRQSGKAMYLSSVVFLDAGYTHPVTSSGVYH